ncbi:MAG: toprim domain-containing protein [Archaeoglobaceae archaeon]
MRRAKIKELIKTFFGSPYREISTGWVMTNCPFAPYTHPDGDDRKFSFGISVKNGFNCFTCGQKGSLYQLPRILARFTKRYNYELEEFISLWADEEDDGVVTSDYSYSEVDFSFLNQLPYANGEKFIARSLAEKWGVKVDYQRRFMYFPYMTLDRGIVNVKVRSLDEKRFYYLVPQAKIWYGEHTLVNYDGKLIIVEGERDAILVSGITRHPVLATSGFPTLDMIKALRPYFKGSIYLWFDNDRAGMKILKFMVGELVDCKRVYCFNWEGLSFKDPAEMIECNSFSGWTKRFYKL